MTDHFCVPVSDVSRSRDFHRQVLGALGMTEDMVFPGASVFGLGRPRRLLDPLQVERSIAGGRPMQDRCRSGRSAPNLHIASRAPPCSHVERFAEMAQMFGGWGCIRLGFSPSATTRTMPPSCGIPTAITSKPSVRNRPELTPPRRSTRGGTRRRCHRSSPRPPPWLPPRAEPGRHRGGRDG